MLAVVEDGVGGFHESCVIGGALSGIQVAVEAREVAAGDFKPDAVAFQKDFACGPEIDLVLVDLAGNERVCDGGGVAEARAEFRL